MVSPLTHRCARPLFAIAILILTAAALLAQSAGTLTGTVTDPTGAVVPNAEVIIKNTQTGVVVRALSNAQGLFRVPDVPIGQYELSITHPGFEKLVRSGIEMLTGRVIDVPVELKVGLTTESLQVTAAAPITQTTSSEVQTTFSARNTQDLPLNGRNPLQLVVLTPGASLTSVGTQGNQQQNTGVTTNGLRALDNNYELDGTAFLDRFFDSAPILPNPDALQEFTVKASNYGASESGGGATVQLSTKSGTNDWHGTAFEYIRNDRIDARNFFAADSTPFKRNQYGGTFGGRIIKDKTFFFSSYQGTRVSGGATPLTSTVPNAAMRNGDFSQFLPGKSILDPLTKQPFPGNIIPSSRFDALSQKLMAYVPLPNVSNLIVAQTPNLNLTDDQFVVRVDHALSEKDRLTFRYSYDEYDYNRATSTYKDIYARNFYRNQNVMASDGHSFSPTLFFVGTFGWTRVARTQTPTEPTTTQALGQQAPFAIEGAAPELRVNVGGYFNLFSGGGLGSQTETFNYRGRFTLAKGSHYLQFGMDIARNLMFSYDRSFASGTSTFATSRNPSTGDGFADFLLGLPQDFTQAARTPQDFYETAWMPWFQDDWKVTRRFTLNLGLRWEPWLPPIDRLGPATAFVPGVQSTMAPFAPKGLLFSGDPGMRISIFPNDWNNFAPRVGFAWDVQGNGKTVVRSAYGIFYRSVPLNLERAANSGSAFRSLTVDIVNPASFQNPYQGYTNPFPFTPPPNSALSTYRFPSPTVTTTMDPASKTGYVQQWNFTAERQIFKDLGLSVAYVGNHSIGIMSAYQANPAVYIPGSTLGLDARRPYQGLGPLAVSSPWGFENYNGLQVQATKRAGHGLTLLGNYVWSKCMDNTSGAVLGADAGGGVQYNKSSFKADYGRCDFDITHVVNISAVYDFPTISNANAFTKRVVNGWSFTTIVGLRSGLPFSIMSGRDNSQTGQPQNDFADQIIPDTSAPSGSDRVQKFFNTSAFVTNAVGTFGNMRRNAMTGPGYVNFDIGAVKAIPITERVGLQFRFEGFNIFNHANFSNPVNTLTNVNFGKITSTAFDPRVMQFALKLSF